MKQSVSLQYVRDSPLDSLFKPVCLAILPYIKLLVSLLVSSGLKCRRTGGVMVHRQLERRPGYIKAQPTFWPVYCQPAWDGWAPSWLWVSRGFSLLTIYIIVTLNYSDTASATVVWLWSKCIWPPLLRKVLPKNIPNLIGTYSFI